MKQSILAARRQRVIDMIAFHAERLGAGQVDLISGIKGNSEHKQLFMLERIEDMLSQMDGISRAESETAVYTLDEILAVEGLSKTSIKALESALG